MSYMKEHHVLFNVQWGLTCRAGGQRRRCPQDKPHSLRMGLALVVGLGHDGGGEEHVAEGAALVLVDLGLIVALEWEADPLSGPCGHTGIEGDQED